VAVRADDVDLDRDRDLVQRYQAGDPAAFDDLYRRYFDRLHGYCQRRVGDRLEAEELAQEAFVRALRAMPTFAGERRFYPWMTVIAQRLCIDHHRRRSRVEPADVIDLGSVEPDHDAIYEAVDHEHLSRAMARLAPRHREVLELREREGLSYTAIGERLDVPVSTVEALLHRARKALRREFVTVAGHNRLWMIPGLGIIASKVSAIRTRIGDRLPELATIATPVAAGVAAAAIALLPSGGPSPARGVTAAAPTHAASAAPSADFGGLAELALPSGADLLPPASDAPAAAAPKPTRPKVAGPADLYIGPGSTNESQERGEQLPVSPQVGPMSIGIDPITIAKDTVGLVLGHAEDEEAP
jgi:RNA polymerase sigma-70 factor (ECF subfamily)